MIKCLIFEAPINVSTLMHSKNNVFLALIGCLLVSSQLLANPILNDTTKAYAMPVLARTPQGQVMLTWTEKDAQGIGSFCMALSADGGKTFSDKSVIYSSAGIGGSRLMRPKVLVKQDGTMMAVFSNRNDSGGKRAIDIMYSVSTNNGTTWSAPQAVDTDPTKGLVRGFFDAIVLANGEVAVVYLKDVVGSTKHEERDLRMAITKNGVFQAEKLLDPVVCDCCNISLLVDNKGVLNVYYRDNNDDVRDIAKMTSTDNGQTFSKPEILHQDNWLIKGCPHSGAFSTTFGQDNLITWFSGGETNKGLRLVSQSGKRLALVNDPTAKNAYVTASDKAAVLLWEQTNGATSQIAYQKVSEGASGNLAWVNDSTNGTNANGLVVGNTLLVAYEVKNPNKKNGIKFSTIAL